MSKDFLSSVLCLHREKLTEAKYILAQTHHLKKIKQYTANNKACVYFYKRGKFKYQGVCITGEMEVCTDQPTKDMIWRLGDKMFYKQGVTDPDYCVLKFKCKSAEYYCDLKTETIDF